MDRWIARSLLAAVAAAGSLAAGLPVWRAEPLAGHRPGHQWPRPGLLKPLTSDPASEVEPKWSPDGASLAFHSARSGNGDIWVLSLSSGALTRLTTSDAFDHFPTWSPDSRFVAFHSNRSGSFDIWVVPAAGGDPAPLTSGPGNDTRPAWSPDGTRIAFGSDRAGTSDLWVLHVTPGEDPGARKGALR